MKKKYALKITTTLHIMRLIKDSQKRIDSCMVPRGMVEIGYAKIARAMTPLASVQKVYFAGVVIIMASIILPWFWIKLALLCSSLVLAVGCLLVLIRRI